MPDRGKVATTAVVMTTRRRRSSAVVVVDVEVPEYSHLNSDSGVDVSRER